MQNRRRAFTLMEVMLVLAILAAFGAIAVPMLGESFKRQRLNASTEDVRIAFDRARLKAMKTGQIQAFECVLETNGYTVRPWMTSSDASNAGAGATVMTGAGQLVETQENGLIAAADATSMSGESKQLDDDVAFVSCQVSSDMRSFTLAQQVGGIAGISMVAQTILFYPDGSASTAEVVLKNKRGDMRSVNIRGLTGSSRVLVKENVPSQSK